jgi:hypothetical protein
MKNKYRDNVKPRERFIVTMKPYPNDAGDRKRFKIVGPNGSGVEIRSTDSFDKRFTVPFQNGAKEIKLVACLGRNGRWCLIDLVEEVVPKAGIEPATARV